MKLALLFRLFPLVLAACSASTETSPSSSESNLSEAPRVHFGASSWDPTWSASPRAGGYLRVDYDFNRLTTCRNQSKLDSWVIEASWRFDGGPITTAALSGSPGASETLPAEGIAIPAGAQSIELWFENKAVGGYDHCDAWDSRYGANYAHDVSP